jgi:tripartite-type tricarboxylate transporter receptor subunit TctC
MRRAVGHTRRDILGLLALSGVAPGAFAQAAFPRGPVRLIVPFPPGGPVDVTARALAQRLGELWSAQVTVENRSGGNSVIGAEAASRAAPDGHTVFVGAIHQSVLPGFGAKLPYDIEKDFTPVMFGAQFPIILCAHPSAPFNNVKELIAYAKKNPGKLAFSSSGNGGGTHLAGELFKEKAGVFMLHIPYRGSAPAMTDLLAGQVQLMFSDGPTAMPHVRSGRVKALAVGSPKRSALVPDLPTMIEAGVPSYEAYSWAGLWVPAATPREVVAKLNADAARAFSDPALKERLLGQGAEVAPGTPEQFGAFVKTELAKWAAVIKRAGIKPD